jgi:hypothetical protein
VSPGPAPYQPYLFNPAPQRPLSGLDEQKALSYRNELRSYQRELQQQPRPLVPDPQRLDNASRTRQELGRMDQLLQPR